MSSVVQAPHPILREVAKSVGTLDKKTLSIIKDMTSTLLAAKKPEGVGLAAPQIGVSMKIFLIRTTPHSKPKVFINPEITKYSQRKQSPNSKEGVYEGCLSIPHHYAPIERSMSVTVKYQTLSITQELIDKIEVFSGFPAHVIQHEMDHLNGILFIDRVLEQNAKLYRIQGKEWAEVNL